LVRRGQLPLLCKGRSKRSISKVTLLLQHSVFSDGLSASKARSELKPEMLCAKGSGHLLRKWRSNRSVGKALYSCSEISFPAVSRLSLLGQSSNYISDSQRTVATCCVSRVPIGQYLRSLYSSSVVRFPPVSRLALRGMRSKFTSGAQTAVATISVSGVPIGLYVRALYLSSVVRYPAVSRFPMRGQCSNFTSGAQMTVATS
jgi:hypothetical protein